MPSVQKPFIKLPLQDAKLVLLAKAAEQSHDKALAWGPTDGATASLRAAHALGENCSAEQLLAERARRVLDELGQRGVATKIGTKGQVAKIFGTLFVLLAFALGALTDRIASPEHMVNLLSPPYWSVIVFNMLFYIEIFCCAIGLVVRLDNRFELPLRSAFVSFVQKTTFTTLRRNYKSQFFQEWSPLTIPLIRMQVARLLHFSAIAFAMGIIVSLLVRGFGTAYWAGWESTWLSDDPSAVKTFLDWTYGLIPAVGPLPPMPSSVDQVAMMRSDELPYLKEAVSAAPWLIRMMLVMAVFVIIPRLIFIIFDSIRIGRFCQGVHLDISDPYYGEILTQCAQDAVLGDLLVVTPEHVHETSDKIISQIVNQWGSEDAASCVRMNYFDEDAPLPAFDVTARKGVAALWLDALATPEEDVQGELIARLQKRYADAGAVLALILDFSQFDKRFGTMQERRKERCTAWQALAEAHSAPIFTVDASDSSTLEAIKLLRTWAAAQPATLKKTEAVEPDGEV